MIPAVIMSFVQQKGSSLGKTKWFASKHQGPVTALDVEGRQLRIVQSLPAGRRGEIRRCASGPLERELKFDQGDAQANGKVLANALAQLRCKPGAVVMGIPRGLVFLRTLRLPKTGTVGELAAMVHFQVSKDLPFPADEAIIDFQIGPSLPTAKSVEAPSEAAPEHEPAAAPAAQNVEVLVAVVKKEIAQRYQEVAAAAGFKLVMLGLEPAANARCVQVCESEASAATVAVVLLRNDEVTVDVVIEGALVFSRSGSLLAKSNAVASGSPETAKSASTADVKVTPAAAPVEAAAIEVLRSFHSYEGQTGHRRIEKIYVAGGTGLEAQLVDVLAKRFSLPCLLLVPGDSLARGSKELKLDSGAVTACGLALAAQDPRGMPFDFIAPKQPPRPRNWRRIKIISAAVAGAFLLLVTLGVRAHLIHRQTRIRDEVQNQLTAAEKNRQLYRDTKAKAKVVHDWALERREWLDHYAYLSAVLPPCTDLYVTSISTGSRGVLHLTVQARSGEVLAQLDKCLRTAGYEVKPLAVTPSKDSYGYSFQSSVELTIPDRLKIDLSKLRPPSRPAEDQSLTALGGGRRRGSSAPAESPPPASPAPTSKPQAAAPSSTAPVAATQPAVTGPPVAFQPSVEQPAGSQDNAQTPKRRPRRPRP